MKKERGITLKKINTWLRRIGLVLVIQVDDEHQQPTRLWIERARRYDGRTQLAHEPASDDGFHESKHSLSLEPRGSHETDPFAAQDNEVPAC
jgi:hypothetical protein